MQSLKYKILYDAGVLQYLLFSSVCSTQTCDGFAFTSIQSCMLFQNEKVESSVYAVLTHFNILINRPLIYAVASNFIDSHYRDMPDLENRLKIDLDCGAI